MLAPSHLSGDGTSRGHGALDPPAETVTLLGVLVTSTHSFCQLGARRDDALMLSALCLPLVLSALSSSRGLPALVLPGTSSSAGVQAVWLDAGCSRGQKVRAGTMGMVWRCGCPVNSDSRDESPSADRRLMPPQHKTCYIPAREWFISGLTVPCLHHWSLPSCSLPPLFLVLLLPCPRDMVSSQNGDTSSVDMSPRHSR